MCNGLVLRPAMASDAAELAILVDIASHNMASWIWYGGVTGDLADTALEYGRFRMADPDQTGGYSHALIGEVDGIVAGAVIAYPMTGAMFDHDEHPVLQVLWDLQKTVCPSFFVDSLAVFRPFRGRGIGRRLMQAKLGEIGSGRASLITESWNGRAMALYRSLRFQEVRRAAAIAPSQDSEPHDWILMERKEPIPG